MYVAPSEFNRYIIDTPDSVKTGAVAGHGRPSIKCSHDAINIFFSLRLVLFTGFEYVRAGRHHQAVSVVLHGVV